VEAVTRVGPYRILRLINRGGQGSVFLGYDGRLRRRVAIKIFRLPAGLRARLALFREARAVAALDSPRVVAVHDLIESPDHLALVMEYVPGCDLEEVLRVRRPSLASVVTIASDISAALAAARQNQVVHGDVKAANILITESGRAKLTDFGISRFGHKGRVAGGSPGAMSPEQCLGEPVDARSDLFALGCLMYRMLAGVPPFHRNGKLDEKWLLERPPKPLGAQVAPEDEVPETLLALVTQLLARDPGDRPATIRRVRSVLREVKRPMPLSQDNTLLLEARPFFRPDAPEEIPPPVPPDLGRGSRSRMAGGGALAWLTMAGWRRTALLALMLAAVGLPAAVIALQPRETLVYIEAPSMDLERSEGLPSVVSPDWLVDQVKTALQDQLGALRVDGPVGPSPVTVFYAGGDRPAVEHDERLAVFLYCREAFCTVVVSRENGGASVVRDAVLLPGMSEVQWAAAVRSATAALYD
jgi:hypothetical protein